MRIIAGRKARQPPKDHCRTSSHPPSALLSRWIGRKCNSDSSIVRDRFVDKIDYIEFPTSDGNASGKFFSDAFGWKLIDYGPTPSLLEN